MKVVPFNRPKAIWEILNECTTAGILDKQKAVDRIDPLEEGQIRISTALLDTFCSESQEQVEWEVSAICNLLKQITERHLTECRIVQKKLKQMDFKTLSVMGELRERVTEECFTHTTYEMFKKILFETSDKEIFKLAITLTTMGEWCEELIEDYMIIGQNEEFSRYISYGFTHWITKKSFEEAAFRLLELSEDWGAVYLTQLLVEQKELLKDINVQRNILVGALKENTIQMELSTKLTSSLDLPRLFELATKDQELFKQLVQLFNSLFFDTGIWEVIEEDTRILDVYIKYLEETKFDTLKLLGAKDICSFIEDDETEQYMVEAHGQRVYDKFRKRVLALWKEVYSIPLLKKCIEEGIGLYSWCNFIKEHGVVELIETCKELYKKDNETNCMIEDVLITIGDLEIKRYIYRKLKAIVNDKERLDEKYSYSNPWGATYARESSIMNKIKVIRQLPFEEVADFNAQLLSDYNPQVRSEAINVLYMRSEEMIKAHENVVERLIDRLGDSPFYIRNDALRLCEEKHIKISVARAKEIEQQWQSKNEKNNMEFMKAFKEIQERIMSIVPPNKTL